MPGTLGPGRRGAVAGALALAAALAVSPAAADDPPADAAVRLLEKRASEDPRDFLTRTMLGEARARRGRETATSRGTSPPRTRSATRCA